jgi:hypothetical protein
MTVLSAAFGSAFTAAAARRRLLRAVPALAVAGCLFGVWYAASALLGL